MPGPRRLPMSILTTALLGTVALAPALAAWLGSTGNPLAYLGHELPPGQGLYVLSKLLGLLAIGLLWLQCLGGLTRGDAFTTRLRPGLRFHRSLGVLVLAAATTHALLFVAAASLRTGNPALALLMPWPGQGYYALHLSYGAMALWLLALGVSAGLARAALPSSAWRWLHWLWVPAFVLLCLHAFGIGSETRSAPLSRIYPVLGTGLAVLALLRLSGTLRRR